MKEPYQVVDLFAGPGGLAEGFSSVISGGERSFDIALSVEMEPAAHRTLTLRAFTRQFPHRRLPKAYYRFVAGEISLEELRKKLPEKWQAASEEALCLELGPTEATGVVLSRIDEIRERSAGRTVLIGGPPCQAYSLVGRARNAGNEGYVPEDDGRHFLYREYIRILERLRPAAFVMENVKGILSSSVAGDQIFERILEDLENVGHEEGGYTLLAMTPSGDVVSEFSSSNPSPRDFVVRAERHGVPQARHRVFVIGLRADVAARIDTSEPRTVLESREEVSVRGVIGDLPRLRSGLSRGDDEQIWHEIVFEAASELAELASRRDAPEALKASGKAFRSAKSTIKRSKRPLPRIGLAYDAKALPKNLPNELRNFLVDRKLPVLTHHETRGHMRSDLARYFFASVFAEANGRAARAADFPESLAPDHLSWTTGKFADRFRVQTWDSPSTTITSHISKDGHYYIHPDPMQCRSLTVREAARLQTFPDNYIFLGNRTQQYVQVGNAVPPFLAKQIAEVLRKVLP